jgi:murein DD-endopeptidase MepM/ murein hydrolase activator NlpD
MPVSRRVGLPIQALGSINLNIVSSFSEAAATRRSRRVENSGAGGVTPARKSHMSLRQQSFQFVENNSNYVVHVTRGQQRRRFEVSRLALFGGAALLSLVGAAVIAAAGYLVFRDDLLAGLIERQTQMQYAYEDRLAAARLRLDQVASRQFIDSDGVEGKVRSLVIRQAMLETRAAVVARLLEHTVQDATGSIAATRILSAPAPAPGLAAGISTQPRATQSAIDDSASLLDGKPRPEGLDLRPGHNPALSRPATSYDSPRPTKSNPAGKGEDHAAVEPSPAAEPSPALANASDPGLPLPARLESLALSLDYVERDQATRLSGIVKPALDAAGKLRRAFDVAGLSVERYMAKAKSRGAASAVGGPFVPADLNAGTTSFERELVVAQNAVETLDGLRHALPSVPLRKPLRGELQMTSTFGYRTDPFLGRPALHSGVDLREEWGTQVHATAAGVVTVAGPSGGYGNMVEVDHGGGLSTRYGHLSAISVSPGQQVSPGAVLGRVGSTGRSTGPHLHYEVRIDGEAVDPSRFLRAATALNGVAQ